MNIIFSYMLSDAWRTPKFKIEVYNKDVDNVVCYQKDFQQKYTISEKSIKEISNIISDYPQILKYTFEDIGFVSGIMDGVHNYFTFFDNELEVFNMWAFRKHSVSCQAKILLEVFDKISEVLIKNNINKDYLRLH